MLVRAEWNRFEASYPGLTWPTFVRHLDRKYRAEERDARRKRLAEIQVALAGGD